jgi:signal peptidase I
MGAVTDRKLRKESAGALAVSRSLLKKNGHKLAKEDRGRVAAAITALESALKKGPDSDARTALGELETHYERHLSKYRKSTLREYLESIGWAVAVALVLRAFVIEAFKIPSGSMVPTLLIGDHIFVNKFIYGLRIPWTFKKWQYSQPKTGDVIVFIKPSEPDKDFVKRVVGLPGDSVEMRGEDLVINGRAAERTGRGVYSYREFSEYSREKIEHRTRRYDETLGGVTHEVLYRGSGPFQDEPSGALFNCAVVGPGDVTPELTPRCAVKPGTVLVMGDNRDNSSDSRVWGLVPLTHVKGRAMFVWWSWGSEGFRWSRIFSWIS